MAQRFKREISINGTELEDLQSIHQSLRADGGEEELVVDGELDRPEAVGQDDGHEEWDLGLKQKS